MSETPTRNDLTRPALSPPDAGRGRGGRPPSGRRRAWRIVGLSLASVFALVAVVAVSGVLVLNHMASSIKRIPVSFARLDNAAASGATGSGAMTVLITSSGIGPTGTGAGSGGGLIMLLHINADKQAGGVVSIHPTSRVTVPGHGTMELQQFLAAGGPTLLVTAVEDLTHVQLQHYARIDFAHVDSVVNAVGGVNVTLPETTSSFGVTFHAGTNHLNGLHALYYARQPSLTEQGRVLRQQSLIRAVLKKIAGAGLLTHPLTAVHVLSALTAMLTLDSNFTNSELAALASELKGLSGNAGTFVSAPAQVTSSESAQLWKAIRKGSIAAFAQKFPATVTPTAVP